jgi:O-antigen ligase
MRVLDRLRAGWARLETIQTVKELVDTVPQKSVETVCVALMAVLCLLPPAVGLTFHEEELFFASGDGLLADSFPYSDYWYMLMSYIGLLSLVVLGCVLLRAGVRLRQAAPARRVWRRESAVPILLGALLLWSALSCLLSGNLQRCFFGTGYRHDGLLSYLYYAGIFAAAAQLGRRAIHKVLEIFAGTAAFLALATTLNVPFLNELFHLRWLSGYANSVFNQFNHYGYYACMSVLVCVWLWTQDVQKPLEKKTAAAKLLRLAELAVLANGLCLSGSGGPILAAGAALVLWTATEWYARKKLPLALLAADGLVLLVFAGLHTGCWSLAEELTGGLQDAGQLVPAASASIKQEITAVENAKDQIFTGRGGLWRAGVGFARQKPLFGYGPDNLGEMYRASGIAQDRPHNELIQIAASLGLPALGFYLAACFRHLWDFWKRLPAADPYTVGLLFPAVAYGVSSLAGNSMFYTTPYFFMLLAFSWSTMHGSAQEEGA